MVYGSRPHRDPLDLRNLRLSTPKSPLAASKCDDHRYHQHWIVFPFTLDYPHPPPFDHFLAFVPPMLPPLEFDTALVPPMLHSPTLVLHSRLLLLNESTLERRMKRRKTTHKLNRFRSFRYCSNLEWRDSQSGDYWWLDTLPSRLERRWKS